MQWGAYVSVSGLVLLAAGPLRSLECDLRTKITLAVRLIHQHEVFHFAVDYALAQAELISGRPIWAPVRERMRAEEPGYSVTEEQLANAWMLRSLWRGSKSLKVKGRSDAVRKFVEMMPVGYRDAPAVVPSSRFFAALDGLTEDYLGQCSEAIDSALLAGVDGAGLLPLRPYIDWRACPVHIVDDGQRLALPPFGIDLLRLAHEIVESERFGKDCAGSARELQPRGRGRKRRCSLTPPRRD